MLGRSLDEACAHDFFRWFHLVRYEPPRGLAGGRAWHGFRPEGAKFRDLVTVNLETDAGGRIADAKLCLDRAFVEHATDAPFARDITVSFLRWALGADELDAVSGLLRELGDLGPNVIRLASAPPPPHPAAPGALYRVYLGRDKDAEQALGGTAPGAKTLRLTNLQARDGPRDPRHDWIWIRVLAG